MATKTINIDYPEKEANTYNVNLKGYDNLELLYDEDISDCFSNTSFQGTTFAMNVCGGTQVYKFTNISGINNLSIKKQNGTTVFTGTFQEFYTEYGNDIEWFPSGSNKVTNVSGSAFNDTISAISFPSSESVKGVTIKGLGGNDSITGSHMNDTLDGGDGDDVIYGDYGKDSISGGAGNDTVYGGWENDTITGGTGTTTAVYDNNYFGEDTYNLTKNEKLNITGLENAQFMQSSKNKSDLYIASDNGNIALKNYLAKDTGATVTIDGVNPVEKGVLKTVDEEYFNPSGKKPVMTYSGTALADVVDASYCSSPTEKGFTINGLGGNDSITGSGFKDNLTGGAGDDTLDGAFSNDTLDGGDGNDSIVGGYGDDVLKGGAGDDTMVGGMGNDTITGGTGTTTVVYNGDPFDVDTYVLTKGEKLDITTDESGTSFVQDSKNKNDLVMLNSKGTVYIKNYLAKDPGATVTLDGENLDDVAKLWVDSSEFVDPSTSKVKVYNYKGTRISDVIDAGSIDSSVATKGLTLDGGAGNDSITGSALNDKLTGGDGNDSIVGGYGNDVLIGGAGDDTLYGGWGYDSITGGTGTTTVVYDGSFDHHTYNLTKGEDLNISGLTNVGFTQDKNKNDLFITSDQGSITVKNYLTKDSGATVTVEGINLVEDAMLGTVGSEYFNPSSGKPVSSYTGTVVADVVDATSYSPVSSSNPKGVTINGLGGNDSITGSYLYDNLNGGAGDDTLDGGYGKDTLDGGDGDDSIVGGYGDDVLKGGAGDDTMVGGAGFDTITGGTGTTTAVYDSEIFGEDTYILTKSEDLNISGLKLNGEEGAFFKQDYKNKADLRILSDKGDIVIKNCLTKDSGATITVNGDNIAEKGVLPVVGSEYFHPSSPSEKANSKYTGTVIADVVDASSYESSTTKGVTIDGGLGCDSIKGSDYDDSLIGGAGDDTMYGGAGNDTITGGTGVTTAEYDSNDFGHDTYTLTKDEELNISGLTFDTITGAQYTQNKNDLVVHSDKGEITIKNCLSKDTGATVTINGDNIVETPVLQATDFLYFKKNSKYTGTAIGDIVDARSYIPVQSTSTKGVTIDGALGNDSITASDFDDSLIGGLGNDTVSAGFGNDTIIGGDGDDVLYGQDGDDDIWGGSGNDSIHGGAGSNTFHYGLGDGNDSIFGGEDAHNTVAFEKGTSVDVSFGEGGDLLIEYTGTKNKTEITNTISVIDYLHNPGVQAIRIGDEIKTVESYLTPAVVVDPDEFISTENNDYWGDIPAWDNLPAGNHTFIYNLDNTNGENNFGSDVIISPNDSENGYTDAFQFDNHSIQNHSDNQTLGIMINSEMMTIKTWNDAFTPSGVVLYDGIIENNPTVQIIDSDDVTYNVKAYEGAQIIDNSGTSTNNIVLLTSEDDDNSFVISNNKYNYTVANGTTLDYTYNGGHDRVETDVYTDDTYRVNSFTASTTLHISEGGGIDDSLTFTASNADDIRVLFDVTNADGVFVNNAQERIIFSHKNAVLLDNIMSAVDMGASDVTGGVFVCDNEGYGIENVSTADVADINESAWYDAVTESVGAWLTSNNYSSVYDAFYGDNPCTDEAQLTALVTAYDVEYSSLP